MSIDTSTPHQQTSIISTTCTWTEYEQSEPSSPTTHGLWNGKGWLGAADSWAPSPGPAPAVDIIVDTPVASSSSFPHFQMGVGGPAAVFDPPQSYWALANPTAGGTFRVPSSVRVGSEARPRLANWTSLAMGEVFAVHGGLWGSWVWSMQAVNRTDGTIHFQQGGWQEARGAPYGGAYYLSGVLEELDDAMEWWLDADQRLLCFQPNLTLPFPTAFVAAQLPCILSMEGTRWAPVSGVTISGLTFAHTSSTYLRRYSKPSGGDWSVHAGGTVYMTGTQHIRLTGNTFTQLGSNAVVLQGYNVGVSIDASEFSWLADSGVVLLGESDGVDGVSNVNQPTNTSITRCLFRATGMYIKQSSPVVQFLSRSSRVVHNLMFNVPRAGVNINDGFHGDKLIAGNAIFNAVRETSDYGPINSWNRLPYLTGDPASMAPLTNRVTGNLLMNGYASTWPIDHDNGSAFWDDSSNVLDVCSVPHMWCVSPTAGQGRSHCASVTAEPNVGQTRVHRPRGRRCSSAPSYTLRLALRLCQCVGVGPHSVCMLSLFGVASRDTAYACNTTCWCMEE